MKSFFTTSLYSPFVKKINITRKEAPYWEKGTSFLAGRNNLAQRSKLDQNQ
nr:MAG TPA: hypothetical protein [Caudoviricetes sp.]